MGQVYKIVPQQEAAAEESARCDLDHHHRATLLDFIQVHVVLVLAAIAIVLGLVKFAGWLP